MLCTLYGGNDGLNTVVPYEDPAYLAARADIAIPPDTAPPDRRRPRPQSGARQREVALGRGQLAIVRGVGYPNASLSHFQSMDIWQSALDELGDVATGWLGRWLDGTACRARSRPARSVRQSFRRWPGRPAQASRRPGHDLVRAPSCPTSTPISSRSTASSSARGRGEGPLQADRRHRRRPTCSTTSKDFAAAVRHQPAAHPPEGRRRR